MMNQCPQQKRKLFMLQKFKKLSPIHWIQPAPSIDLTLERSSIATSGGIVNRRTLFICAIAMILAVLSTFVAHSLVHLIAFFTNLAFFGRNSIDIVSPGAAPNWGLWVIPIPVVGGIVVGFMARYGSKAIRGHGIPEAMEQILLNESRIPLRMTFLKPLSSAIAIGTGGPFGAEGPIIATGGALGSYLGQVLHTTPEERKTLLAAGAAAGMTAIFGSPIAAVLLAFELLLFEFRPRSLIPVALATVTAGAARIPFFGTQAVFKMQPIAAMHPTSLLFFLSLGLIVGLASIIVTKLVYWVEDAFEHLPVHWMWWPAIGGVAVGVIGYYFPRTLGVGYENIDMVLSGQIVPMTLGIFCVMKFLSWSIALGSGTSGGTLAPLFTIGGGIGALVGVGTLHIFPSLEITPAVAALVGMAAIFAGASRALLTSIVFAFETTQQPQGLMPLLAGCSVSYLVSGYLMRNSIMTEKIVRRGVNVPTEYHADPLESLRVGDFATTPARTVNESDPASTLITSILERKPAFSHQGFPVIDAQGALLGVITRKDLLALPPESELPVGDLIKRPPIAITAASSLREAINLMTQEGVGRLPVVSSDGKRRVIGILTRSDLLTAQTRGRSKRA
jgi:CIC family chloride channel protein